MIKGLNVDATEKNWQLQTKRVNIIQCTLLTMFNDAKLLAYYKIAIDANKQNVVNDPTRWPRNVKGPTLQEKEKKFRFFPEEIL